MREVILRASNVSFTYEGENKPALENISIEIKRGKKVALMGENGSGKSTFFLCCLGILQPQIGTFFFKEKPYVYSKKELLALRKKIGMVFQNPDDQLFCASVYQDISFGILNMGVSKEEAQKEVERIIDTFEISPFRHKSIHALSGGQKKQVSIADILVMKPEMVLFDEPVSSLDPKHRKMVRQSIDATHALGMTILMSTHDVDYAYAWADEVIVFHKGHILVQGPPLEVFSKKEDIERAYLEQPTVLKLYHALMHAGKISAQTKIPKDIETLIQEVQMD